MTTCLEKSCSFGLLCVSFVNCYQFCVRPSFPFGYEGGIWDLTVLVSDHCLSTYPSRIRNGIYVLLGLHIEFSSLPKLVFELISFCTITECLLSVDHSASSKST